MPQEALRPELLTQLDALLQGGQAHVGFEKAVQDFPFDKQGVVPTNLPYSAWQIVEHLRIAQRDILDFCTDADGTGYKHLEWPAAYWPKEPAPPDGNAWDRCIAAVLADRRTFLALLQKGSLTEPFPWGDGQTLLREALLIADHTAYHVGELIVVRRLLHTWSPR